MNKQLLSGLVLIVMVTAPGAAFGGSRDQDETEIRAVETQQQEAWNRRDAKAYASLFTEDGDCVNVVGWWWKGRAEIEKKLTDAYVFVFRESVLTIKQVDVRFLGPDFAVAHVPGPWLAQRHRKISLNPGKVSRLSYCRNKQANG
jgi:uncharacterized protein (TIGR02246 family)